MCFRLRQVKLLYQRSATISRVFTGGCNAGRNAPDLIAMAFEEADKHAYVQLLIAGYEKALDG